MYIGSYVFNVQQITYTCYETDQHQIITRYDTVSYMYHGRIDKFQLSQLLIQYSGQTPLFGCQTMTDYGSKLCRGDSLSDCILACSDSNLTHLRYWITPEIDSKGSLNVFEVNYRIFGEGFLSYNDSLFFTLEYPEKMYGWKDRILGYKEK
jgi:hypothetical protein